MDKDWRLATGLILALGTTRIWLLADFLLFFYVLWQPRKRLRGHWIIYSLAGIIGITALWSPDPVAAILTAVRVVCLYSVARSLTIDRKFWTGAAAVLAVQLVIAVIQLPNETRPFGLSMNASQLGQTGFVYMATPLAPIAAFTLGLSTARSAALGLIVLNIGRRSRRLFAWSVVAAAIFLTVIFWKTPDRIQPAGIAEATTNREALVDGVVPATSVSATELESACGEARPRAWKVVGYGWHGYCASTGLQRPHNLWILSFWDLGILSVPFWTLVAIGAWKSRQYSMIAALVAVGMITEELFARPEGFYMIAVALGALKRPGHVYSESPEMDNSHGDQAGRDVVESSGIDQQEQQKGLNPA